MSNIFLSHSSKDKQFVRRLAIDLMKFDHDVWLDEWDIRVGECIVTGVQGGIENSDFAVIILSPNAVVSDWVDKEWKAKYWTEANGGDVSLLPVLLEDCTIPLLLRTKKYADFRTEYETGLAELLQALSPADRNRLVFRERVEAARRDLIDLITIRVGSESKVFFGKELTWDNHPERFAEVTHFAQETHRIYVDTMAAELDNIVELFPTFGVKSDYLSQHRKYSMNTMGWRAVADALGEISRQLARASSSGRANAV